MFKKILITCLLGLLSSPLFASSSEKAMSGKKGASVAFIAKLDKKSGKKVWLIEPANFVAKEGKPLHITVKNEFKDAVHGFKIAGLVEAMPIPGMASKKMTVTPKKAGKYKVECHMHPAHVGTVLVVK